MDNSPTLPAPDVLCDCGGNYYSADQVRAIIAECRRPAAMVEAVATYPDLTVEQKSAANIWDHVDEVLPVIELARAGKWSPYENMACKYIVLRIDMRDGGCILKNAKGERINPADLRKQYTAGHQWPAWATECHPLADWQKQAIRDAAPVGEKL